MYILPVTRFGMKVFALMVLVMAAPANATVVNFTFDPNDFIDLYSTTPLPVDNPSGTSHLKYQQDNPRRVHEQWGATMYNTFGTTGAETDQQSQDAYIAWRNSLTTQTDGIGSFNIWLRDNANAWNWGERLVSNPDYMPTATAASGWNYNVLANPWGTGWLVEWWTDDPNNRINLVNNIDPFSFMVDVREIASSGETFADGVGISDGTSWDIWFGTWHDINSSNKQYSDWVNTGGWEGALQLTAVPEPATLALMGLGLAGLGFTRRKSQ